MDVVRRTILIENTTFRKLDYYLHYQVKPILSRIDRASPYLRTSETAFFN
jgi:hypothetical protein